MNTFEQLIPSIICTGLLGLVWYVFRSKIESMEKEISNLKKTNEEFITSKMHVILCENSSLRIRQHVSTEINVLREEMTDEFTQLKSLLSGGK